MGGVNPSLPLTTVSKPRIAETFFDTGLGLDTPEDHRLLDQRKHSLTANTTLLSRFQGFLDRLAKLFRCHIAR
jgi:hypothetical protein